MSSEIVKMFDNYINKLIQIKLRNKKTIQGNLQSFDQMLNLTLTNSKDITENEIKSLDRIILRGDNITVISFPEKSNSPNPKEDASI